MIHGIKSMLIQTFQNVLFMADFLKFKCYDFSNEAINLETYYTCIKDYKELPTLTLLTRTAVI